MTSSQIHSSIQALTRKALKIDQVWDILIDLEFDEYLSGEDYQKIEKMKELSCELHEKWSKEAWYLARKLEDYEQTHK